MGEIVTPLQETVLTRAEFAIQGSHVVRVAKVEGGSSYVHELVVVVVIARGVEKTIVASGAIALVAHPHGTFEIQPRNTK